MEGLIDKVGNLKIKRGGVMKSQFCPKKNGLTKIGDIVSPVPHPCGDHCPLFGEPESRGSDIGHPSFLDICNGKGLAFSHLEDNRPK